MMRWASYFKYKNNGNGNRLFVKQMMDDWLNR